ncbi:hypothetical protein Tsubulata_046043 [Turnera subulata]|uniref:LysM domain-containing protein n=1 Tax=Turnera subulata TaxID=218843 RepID=A0A9Q0GJL5_9ROSI|nr:hypothetical protein Tsubulata_046043 [Turnera subulata]
MGCCGDQEDDHEAHNHLTQPLNSPTTDVSPQPTTTMDGTTISPMNSHFTALACPDTLRLIFHCLSLPDLARASCVCRAWRHVGSDGEMVKRAFMGPWRLKEVVGRPASTGFWRDNGIWKFAVSHKIKRGDSVAGLAVRYSVQVMDIKRLNNMMSDHGIYSRDRLLIPVSNPDLLVNATCYIELDTYAKREVAVLYLEGEPDRKLSCLATGVTSDRGRRRIVDSLKRSMQVDDGTAQYYFSISNGDPRAALAQFSADISWERQGGVS